LKRWRIMLAKRIHLTDTEAKVNMSIRSLRSFTRRMKMKVAIVEEIEENQSQVQSITNSETNGCIVRLKMKILVMMTMSHCYLQQQKL